MMNFENKKDILSKGLNIHFKLILLAGLMVAFFWMINGYKMKPQIGILLTSLIFIQLEVFIWLGRVMFNFELGKTPKEITWKIVKRFLQYYFVCLVSAAFLYVAHMFFLYLYEGTSLVHLFPNIVKYEMKQWLIATNGGLILGAFMFFLMQWQHALKREQQLREEKLNFQYQTLNRQVNPHFLFNSLNTLSSFIASKPAIAEKFVVKMASTYRYIIDNGSKNEISLDNELHFITDYFYLHKLRDVDKIDLQIDIPDSKNYTIIPVSLQILIENALKHNMATTNNPLLIKVYIEDKKIVVQNNLQKKSSLESSLKKGLKNLDERINLSCNKRIDILETNNQYIVKLPLLS